MKIEKLDNFDTNYIYSMNGPIGRLVDRMHQLIDAFNSLENPKTEWKKLEGIECIQCKMAMFVNGDMGCIDYPSCRDKKKEKEPELLPCPFCGVPPDISETLSSYFIKCGNSLCDFVVENAYKLKSKKEAIETWNKRKC